MRRKLDGSCKGAESSGSWSREPWSREPWSRELWPGVLGQGHFLRNLFHDPPLLVHFIKIDHCLEDDGNCTCLLPHVCNFTLFTNNLYFI